MRKTLTYSTFGIAILFVILMFVTAKSYLQLGIAMFLYIVIAYFALKFFPHHSRRLAVAVAHHHATASNPQRASVEVADIDKRTFLKLVGAAGLSFFIFSLLGRRADNLLFGGGAAPPQAGQTSASSTEGYKIAEIDEGTTTYYGFTNKDGAWFIMREDTDIGSFRYAKGDSSFSGNWANRGHLKYDYYSNVF